MHVQAYLSFEGRCAEALEFYKQAIGAEILCAMKFSESPEACPEGALPPGSEDKIMHSAFKVGDTEIMATDGSCTGKASFQGISLTISVTSDAEVERLYQALSDGGQATMPLNKTFFASSFGMVNDRFGVCWMLINPATPPA